MTAARVTPLYALLEPQQQTLVRTTLESQGGNAADLDQLDACAAGLWDRAALPLYLNLTPLDRQLLHIFNVGRPGEPDAPTLLSSVPIKGKGNGPLLFPTPVGTLTTLHLNLLGVPMPGGYLTLTSNEIMPVSTFLQAYNAGNLKVAAALHRLLGRRRPWSDLYNSMALAFGCMIKEPHTPKLAACAVHVSPPPALSVRDRETLTDLHRLIPGEDYVLSFHWDKKTVTDFQVFTVSGQPCLIFPETVVADFLRVDPVLPVPSDPISSQTWTAMQLSAAPMSAYHQSALRRFLLVQNRVLAEYFSGTRGYLPDRHAPFRSTVTFTAVT